MTKLERLRELATSDEGKDLSSLKMLLRVCDAYIEQYTYAHNSRPECGCMMCERCRDEARARLEEMLG